MDFNFDWNYVKSGMPYVTFSSTSIAFNPLAVTKFGSPKKVIIGFDEENMVIGVKGVGEEDSANYKSYDFAKSSSADGWIRIGCREFLQQLAKISGISFSKAIRFGVEFHGDLLTINVSKDNILSTKS